jgi:aspartate 4-decarboxylase
MGKLSPFELKDQLIEVASEQFKGELLNAGRGNPNFLSIMPRKIFNLIGEFAISEAEYSYSYLHSSLGGNIKEATIASRFFEFLKSHRNPEAAKEMMVYFSYLEDQLGLNVKEALIEFLNAYLACNYPVPPRSLKNIEKILKKYIVKEMCNSKNPGKFDVFPVEGGTAAMAYIFNTLKVNKLIKKEDKIAIITPVFTPYLEIPGLPEYGNEVVRLQLDPELNWQLADSELEKLKDPSIKLLCVVNPSNPPSTKIKDETLKKIKEMVDNERQDLMFVTDDVYGTFADDFESLFAIVPKNTLLVYSFSKYFGATGWRLGCIAVAEGSIFDKMIADLPDDERKALEERYSIMTPEPSKLKFIDRLVADSRAVALNHTGGLSLPQQLQMALFALSTLTDIKDVYKNNCKHLIRSRYNLLYSSLGIKPIADENIADYYTMIDIAKIGEQLYGKEFAEWLEKDDRINDFLFSLARETSVVLMPGEGFGSSETTLRVSLANLKEYQYEQIGELTKKILEEYYVTYTKE